MTTKARLSSSLLLAAPFLVVLFVHEAAKGESEERAPASGRPAWLMRGGDIHRASQMKEWKSLGEEGRLAASADLVTMQLRRAKQPIPSPAELEALARALESKLTEVSASGSRDEEYVGSIVDEVWPSIR